MKNFLILFFLAFPFVLPAITGDSSSYLLPQDTVFITLDQYKDKIFTHVVEKNQTLYSLGKFYGLHTEEIYYYNPKLKDQVISPQQKIRIPIPNRAILRYKTLDFLPDQYAPVYYVVKKGDTFFSISSKIFKMPMDTIAARNNMENHILSIGQQLFIGWVSINGIPETYRKKRANPEYRKSDVLRNKYVQGKHIKRERKEQGAAFWQKNGDSSSDLYALHRKAPINSVIAVTNPMSRRKVYAKVIGRIPENVYGTDIIIVVSPKVADLLGAKDPRFFVKLNYLR